ncbi:MAG: hypothetical protein RIQ79_804 [Verrucomicrobiota bacterium]
MALPPSPAPLTQEAYVWQHAHNASVQNAIAEHGSAFRQITVLAAEVTWPPRAEASPEIKRISLKLPPANTCPPIGLAIRVHAYRGSFSPEAPATRQLVALAHELISRIEADGHHVREFQIDFDAAESQLDAYRCWLEALRSSLAPVPVAFTALPSWLDHPAAFTRLARAADGFILQVHSLALPASPDALAPLCDPGAALRAIRLAAEAGVPFRVALPTYGYEAAFDPRRHRFLGLAADGSARAWPADAIIRTVRADPATLANLVSGLQRHHPAALTGLTWYRLPIFGERLNWPWPTLAAVMDGREPAAKVSIEAVSAPADPALIRLVLRNSGEADAISLSDVVINWSDARRVAADALAGFSIDAETTTRVRLSPPSGFRLPPDATLPVGWLRLNHAPSSFHATLSP